MNESAPDNQRYPTGPFQRPEKFKKGETKRFIRELDRFPKRLKDAVKSLSPEQLDTPYRDGGWTVRQVIHHLADSHMNAFCRLRLALTEENPTIKPYDQDRWAQLVDSRTADIKFSLNLLAALHKRWTLLLKTLEKEEFIRTFHHPEEGRDMPLYESTALYAWHSYHHLAHITGLKERKGWA
jgi:hypothetical protein